MSVQLCEPDRSIRDPGLRLPQPEAVRTNQAVGEHYVGSRAPSLPVADSPGAYVVSGAQREHCARLRSRSTPSPDGEAERRTVRHRPDWEAPNSRAMGSNISKEHR
jgi:hypothetical protein